jgi:2-polyprenyl-3-methyl-5-hydroxy-6-metoxy-1,4-benzoquinol methylase
MPVEDEIWKAYTTYYTHMEVSGRDVTNVEVPIRALMKICKPFLKLFTHATGLRGRERDFQRKAAGMFLGAPVPGGRLLDVGCGNGDVLARMCRSGWSGEGVDTDPEAVANARTRHGLTVHLGRLEDLRFPGETFDAITMKHVIEHVHDPVGLVRESLRILKPGGRIVLVTPNVNGLGHRWFGEDWRGLEPPRHLRLFSPSALRMCAVQAGFHHPEAWCTPGDADGMIRESLKLRDTDPDRRRRAFLSPLIHPVLTYYEVYRSRTDEEAGEEIVLIGRKAGGREPAPSPPGP